MTTISPLLAHSSMRKDASLSSLDALASATAGSSGTTTDPGADASDRFLTLLVTQLKNQDPLNPLDNAQITSQLAQISTVSGINKLNDTVATLAASFAANQYLQSAGLVGHDVVVAGNDLDLRGSASGGVTLGAAADTVSIAVTDASSALVRTIALPPQSAGTQFFTWDGKTDAGATAPDGHYTFTTTATAAGKPVQADALHVARVEGVVAGSNGTTLQLPNGVQIALAQILEIR
jgi:flagellar basal-body rod modification protein FlgD